jgi:RNA polymerase sigma-70 factor (ECF subfamily)
VKDLSWLLEQAQRGDMQAFGLLCRAVESRLHRQAIVLGADASLAEDLAQETFVEAWKCLDRYNGQCQFFTWLCAILHNRYRSFARRKRLISLWTFVVRDQDEAEDASERQPDPQALPDEAAQLREQAAMIRRCVETLPAKQQQVIYLRFFVDDSLESIALALGCSVGTVKSRLFHALEKLRRMPALGEQRADGGRQSEIL